MHTNNKKHWWVPEKMYRHCADLFANQKVQSTTGKNKKLQIVFSVFSYRLNQKSRLTLTKMQFCQTLANAWAHHGSKERVSQAKGKCVEHLRNGRLELLIVLLLGWANRSKETMKLMNLPTAFNDFVSHKVDRLIDESAQQCVGDSANFLRLPNMPLLI